MLRRLLTLGTVVALLAAAQIGCSGVGYNPYVANDGHRPIGKSIEAGPEAGGSAIDWLDARFENAFY